MASIKLAYIGGGSSRAPGTMASFIEQWENFDGSEVVLVDLHPERLALVKKISEKMARVKGMRLTVTTTTDWREGIRDCDAILSSYRPGEFEARYLDESIPLKHNVIGQETQGPGGFFMALRSIHILKEMVEASHRLCPGVKIFNYTNPVNIVAQAVAKNSDVPVVSLCEGPIVFPGWVFSHVDVHDASPLKATMIGLNHGCWSVSEEWQGGDIWQVLQKAYDDKLRRTGGVETGGMKNVRLALDMRSLPADYFYYYYFKDFAIQALKDKPTTRAQDIMAELPGYWEHYREQAESDHPVLDPRRSRGGIHELELALDVMDAVFNDKGEVHPVNVMNNGSIPDFEDDIVVEVPAMVDKNWIRPIKQPNMPRKVVGLVKQLAEYQYLTAEAAWSGNRKDGIAALAANPLVLDYDLAERLYDEMAAAHRAYLPERLLH